MNREILFRAKTTKKNNPNHEFNEKWVEGNLILCGDKAYIHPVSNKIDVTGEIGRIIVMHEIDPDTLCQYTGLTDKNGKRIWENDICDTFENDSKEMLRNVVKFEDGCFKVFKKHYLSMHLDCYEESDLKVVGNIFDNADLFEVK